MHLVRDLYYFRGKASKYSIKVYFIHPDRDGLVTVDAIIIEIFEGEKCPRTGHFEHFCVFKF